MFHINIFNSPDNLMKHDDNISRKTILTLYLSLSILFTFILCVESSVNVTVNITANVTANVTITTNSTNDKSSASPSPFDERTVTIIIYFIITLMFGIPILTFLACIYHTKGSAPCDFKEAFCNCC